MTRYWAKKPWDGAAPTVAEHCRQVRRTADVLFDVVEESLGSSLESAGNGLTNIRQILGLSALLHDIAKVNSSFQSMLTTRLGDCRQPVRHEILAAWLLTDRDILGTWISALRTEAELWPMIWAIAGHHLKMGDPARGQALFDTGSGTRTVAIPLSTAEDVGDLLEDVGWPGSANPKIPQLRDLIFDTSDEDGLEQRINLFAETSCDAWNRLRCQPGVKLQSALLKALLISADVAASALTAKGELPQEWVPRSLGVRISATALIKPIQLGTKGKSPLPFQTSVGAAGRRTIVIAGCGNGKTTAAYLWAQRHAEGRKLWFTYPTTGTASAGYRGYLHDHPDLKALLLHGRAEVDLQAIRGNDKTDDDDEWLRLESLRAWGQQAIACTVDTVLGLLQNHRRPLFSFPAIAAGAFVFDEIHSYDARLFGALLRFLETFPGCPALVMSASIPPRRLAALHAALGTTNADVISGDQAMESHKRYLLQPRDSTVAIQADVSAALATGKKVLWVCNTVKDAVDVARDAAKWSGISADRIIIFHSRFKYDHRVQRQQQVLDEFKYHGDGPQQGQRHRPGAALVVATQVCEMSLDISADLLVTAECPLPSLIQRLGRLNRYASCDDPWPCFIYPFRGDPYNENPEWIQLRGDYRPGMAAARKALAELAGIPCSQRELASRLDGMDEDEDFEKYSAWLDDGWLTEPGQLRDGDGGLTLILQGDFPEIETKLGKCDAKPSQWTSTRLVPWTIPMLFRRGFQPVERVCGYPVAGMGTITYSMKEGAAWAESE